MRSLKLYLFYVVVALCFVVIAFIGVMFGRITAGELMIIDLLALLIITGGPKE